MKTKNKWIENNIKFKETTKNLNETRSEHNSKPITNVLVLCEKEGIAYSLCDSVIDEYIRLKLIPEEVFCAGSGNHVCIASCDDAFRIIVPTQNSNLVFCWRRNGHSVETLNSVDAIITDNAKVKTTLERFVLHTPIHVT